jgi:phage-related tail fiber protein
MADQIYKAIPTEVGLTKIQQAMWTGSKLQLVTLVYGDGELDINTMHTRTELAHQLGNTPIDAAVMDTEEVVTWITAVIGAHLPNGVIRELGLIDTEGDLCFIANTPEIDKVEIADGTLIDIPIEFGIKNSYSEYVEIPFDPSGQWATRGWVENYYAHKSLDNINAYGRQVIKDIAYGPIVYYAYDTCEFELPYDPSQEEIIIDEAVWEERPDVPPDNPDHEVQNG